MNLIIIRYNVTKLLHGRPTPHNPARTQVVFVKIVKKKKKTLHPPRGKRAMRLQGRVQVPVLPGDYSSSLKHKVCSLARWPDSNTSCVGLLRQCCGDWIIYVKKKDSTWHRENTF